MNWFTKMFTPTEKPDWRLCKQMDVKYVETITDRNTKEVTDKTNGVMTYYLYEDQNGNRKFDVVDSIDGELDIEKIAKNHFAFRCEDFRNILRTWLDGRYVPEIPDYETIPKDDFQNRLAKKKIK